MNHTKVSSTNSDTFYTNQSENNDTEIINEKLEKLHIPEVQLDPLNKMQNFYKSFSKGVSGEFTLIHGYKIFRIMRSEEDLTIFCLSLLQFEADFPLKFVLVDSNEKNTKEEEEPELKPEKDVWLETQFLVSNSTSKQETITNQVKLEHQIFTYFKEFLIPMLVKFKNEKINWVHMTSEGYNDEKVVLDFNENIVKKVNLEFKAFSKESLDI